MIAISYRRDDSLPIAGRLYDRLQAKFGKQSVFMDFDSIRPGLDFRTQIKETIDRSNLVIALVGPHWLGEQRGKSRRIDDPTDFVRLEIACALKRGIPVIPVLINNTPMPTPEKLPPDIKELSYRHAVSLDSGLDFHQHADRLIASIVALIGEKQNDLILSRATSEAPARVWSLGARQTMMAACGIAIFLVALTASSFWFFGLHHRQAREESMTAPVKEQATSLVEATAAPMPASQSNTIPSSVESVPMPSARPAASTLASNPSLTPTVISAEAEDEQARQLIRDYYAAFARHDLEGVVSKFEDTVDYQGQGLRSKSYIRTDATNYLRRWDRISFNVRQISFSRTAEGDLIARFDSRFTVGERNAPDKSGTSSNVWVLRRNSEGSLHIISQRESLLKTRAEQRQSHY